MIASRARQSGGCVGHNVDPVRQSQTLDMDGERRATVVDGNSRRLLVWLANVGTEPFGGRAARWHHGDQLALRSESIYRQHNNMLTTFFLSGLMALSKTTR
jgi:hypothetical protein